VATALRAFLRAHPPFAVDPPSWSFARLAVLVETTEPRWRLALLKQNGALAAWRSAGGGAFAELCEREPAVERYRALAPAAGEPFARWLRATPADLPLEAAGVRWVLIAAERDEAAATLTVRLRVTNPGSDERPLGLDQLRLAGLANAPVVDPPAQALRGGLVRELRLTFSAVPDAVAEAAVLVVRPGAELQAYSEDLR
jgi:hypothetical protein